MHVHSMIMVRHMLLVDLVYYRSPLGETSVRVPGRLRPLMFMQTLVKHQSLFVWYHQVGALWHSLDVISLSSCGN